MRILRLRKLKNLYRKLAVADHLLQFCGSGFECKFAVPSSAKINILIFLSTAPRYRFARLASHETNIV